MWRGEEKEVEKTIKRSILETEKKIRLKVLKVFSKQNFLKFLFTNYRTIDNILGFVGPNNFFVGSEYESLMGSNFFIYAVNKKFFLWVQLTPPPTT